MSEPATLEDLWSCYTCDYLGVHCVDESDGQGGESCPNCGTEVGDGFGMAQNDPRYRSLTLEEVRAAFKELNDHVTEIGKTRAVSVVETKHGHTTCEIVRVATPDRPR